VPQPISRHGPLPGPSLGLTKGGPASAGYVTCVITSDGAEQAPGSG